METLTVLQLLLLCLCPGVISLRERGEVYQLLRTRQNQLRVLNIESLNPEELFSWPTRYDVEAKAVYRGRINETGWAFLEIHSNESKSNEAQVYGTGYLEGYITYELIYMHWFNTLSDFCDGSGRQALCSRLKDFIDTNTEYVKDKIERLGNTDQYWHHVKLFYLQVQGLADGYKAAQKDAKKSLTYEQILWLNLQGDFEDLTEVLKAQERDFYEDEEYLHPSARGLGHCSALIKILPDGSDLFVSQETWSTYQSMLRIQKKYVMALTESTVSRKRVAGVAMSLSSYPGVITSGDDFYLISSGIATLETTIGNGNASLWKYVEPNGKVFESVRSVVANRLATDGRSWSKLFSRFNSGTYNNQWMVVDYNKFRSSKGLTPDQLPDDLLWVLEQIPNFICAADVTDVLRKQTYWASYNVAYFPQIYNISGNWESVAKFGDWFTYDKNPRAQIFRRDHVKVKNIESMLDLMRYNDYQHDPLSRCDCNPPYSAENAIAARCDLNPPNGIYPFPALGHRQHGATDAKITSSVLFNDGLMFLGVSGPVFNESRGIPPFSWSASDFSPTTPHLGHPDLWKFPPVIYQWV